MQKKICDKLLSEITPVLILRGDIAAKRFAHDSKAYLATRFAKIFICFIIYRNTGLGGRLAPTRI